MNNFFHDGHILEVIAPYEVVAGDGLLRESLFGIATTWAPEGEPVSISTSGVFNLSRQIGDNWKTDEIVYWNDNSRIFTRNTSGAVMIGFAISEAHGHEKPWVRTKLLGYAARQPEPIHGR